MTLPHGPSLAVCEQFKEMGFLAESMVNYLALLGWNDGTEEEIFTRKQLGKSMDAPCLSDMPW